jgi:hypothetical protein
MPGVGSDYKAHSGFLILGLIVLCAAVGFFIFKAFSSYIYWSKLASGGVVEEAKITDKKLYKRKLLPLPGVFGLVSSDYVVEVAFIDLGKRTTCVISVPRNLYKEYELGETVAIVYLKENPSRCELKSSVKGNKLISEILVFIGFSLLILLVIIPGAISVFLLYYFRGRKVDIRLKIPIANCPECGLSMEEGYVPAGAGIHWRGKGEKGRISTVFSALPRTVWWNPFNRSNLPGLHCSRCKIVLFKYG